MEQAFLDDNVGTKQLPGHSRQSSPVIGVLKPVLDTENESILGSFHKQRQKITQLTMLKFFRIPRPERLVH